MATNANQSRPAQQALPQTPEAASALLEQVLAQTGKRTPFIKSELEKRIEDIEDVLPPQMKGQGSRLAKRAVMTFARQGASLNDCSAADFIRAVLEAAEVGLAIDGRLAHVVPFKQKWQLIIDYKGLVAVARRTGQIADIYAEIVCQNDSFVHGHKNGSCILEHTFRLGDIRGDVIGCYAIVTFSDKPWRYELMDRPDLDRIQRRAPSQKGPWATDTNEMRRKTIIRRTLKMYCDDPAITRALEIADYEDEESADEAKGRDVVKDILSRQQRPYSPPPPPSHPNDALDPPDRSETQDQSPDKTPDKAEAEAPQEQKPSTPDTGLCHPGLASEIKALCVSHSINLPEALNHYGTKRVEKLSQADALKLLQTLLAQTRQPGDEPDDSPDEPDLTEGLP